MMKRFLVIILVVYSGFVFAQRPSESIKDKNLYGSNTKWSCADKHFGYYFVNYSKPIPLLSSLENELRSGVFTAGYVYRYKIFKPLDFGSELSFQNRRSIIEKDSLSLFDPGTFYNKIFTYHNSVSASVFVRLNISKADYRNLGYFIDFGAQFSYALGYGTGYLLKNESILQKTRFKKPYYADPMSYGFFVRAGFNNIALIVSWHEGNWITDFSNQNLTYERSPLMFGVQMNLYAK